jgi:hypothetical protein
MSDDEAEEFWASTIEEWEAYGLRCRARPGFGSINGYVQIPAELFSPETAEQVLTVHYSVTYGPDDDGWVGFDTAHAGDYWAPDDLIKYVSEGEMQFVNEMREMSSRMSWGRRWTMERLKQETEQLAQQVAVALDLASIDITKGEE